MKQKGFIGAIGDDLPSLIPIIISLLLFFSIFTLTLNTYNDKNMELRKQIGLMSISRSIKGESLILDLEYFENNCEKSKLRRHPYNFMAAIYSSEDLSFVLDDFFNSDVGMPYPSAKFLTEEDNGSVDPFFCGYRRIGSPQFSSQRTNYSLRYYPVAIQKRIISNNGEEHVLVLPVVMAMVIWE